MSVDIAKDIAIPLVVAVGSGVLVEIAGRKENAPKIQAWLKNRQWVTGAAVSLLVFFAVYFVNRWPSEDDLLGPNKSRQDIEISGSIGDIGTTHECPAGYYLAGLRSAQQAGGRNAADAIVRFAGICRSLLSK